MANSWVGNLKKKVHDYFYGTDAENALKKSKAEVAKKMSNEDRAKAISKGAREAGKPKLKDTSSQLKDAGLDDKDLAKLGGT